MRSVGLTDKIQQNREHMRQFTVTFFEEKDGTIPFRRWFFQQSPKVQDKT